MQGVGLAVSKRCAKELPGIASSWLRAGGYIREVDRFWTEQGIVSRKTKIYGNDAFCRTVAKASELSLVSPRDELLAELDRKWTHRKIEKFEISDFNSGWTTRKWPLFIKPVEPKKFAAFVCHNPTEFQIKLEGFPLSTQILVSEVVNFRNEARAFVVDGKVADCKLYMGDGDQFCATRFVSSLTRECWGELPTTFVVDVGELWEGWAVIEFNAVWASHPKQCSPDLVLPCIAAGTLET